MTRTIFAPGTSGPGTRARALDQVGLAFSPGWCLYWCLTRVFKVPGLGDYDHDGDADATDYWKAAVKRGQVVKTSDPAEIPAGVLISWTGGRHGYGHAAYSLGSGEMISTDLPTRGKIGRVPIDRARTEWGLKLVGYVLVDGNGFTLTRDPAPDPRLWFDLELTNHNAATKALEEPGAAEKFLKRRKDLVNITLKDVRPDVLCGLECGAGAAWRYLSTKYRQGGYKLVPGGKDGRHIWVDKDVTVTASGAFDPPRFAGNDMPAPWMIGEIHGTPGMVVLSQLDYRAEPDEFRVKQQAFVIAQALKKAAEHDIGPSRIVFASDTASENWVRDKALEPAGYADAFDVAEETANAEVKSYNEYKPPRPGPRVDLVGVYVGKGPGKGDDHARPVLEVKQLLNHKATDHHVTVASIGRQAA